jgi:hypothetical protein
MVASVARTHQHQLQEIPMSWTQPVCDNKFKELNPGRIPVRIKGIPKDPCCFCKTPTDIYVRIDPTTVPYPMKDEEL